VLRSSTAQRYSIQTPFTNAPRMIAMPPRNVAGMLPIVVQLVTNRSTYDLPLALRLNRARASKGSFSFRGNSGWQISPSEFGIEGETFFVYYVN